MYVDNFEIEGGCPIFVEFKKSLLTLSFFLLEGWGWGPRNHKTCTQYIAKKMYKETETLPLVETHVVQIISITYMQIVNMYRQQTSTINGAGVAEFEKSNRNRINVGIYLTIFCWYYFHTTLE